MESSVIAADKILIKIEIYINLTTILPLKQTPFQFQNEKSPKLAGKFLQLKKLYPHPNKRRRSKDGQKNTISNIDVHIITACVGAKHLQPDATAY
jgi:hypothetical protein